MGLTDFSCLRGHRFLAFAPAARLLHPDPGGPRTRSMKQTLATLALVAAATLAAAAAPNHMAGHMTGHMTGHRPAMKALIPAKRPAKKHAMMRPSKANAMKPGSMATHRP